MRHKFYILTALLISLSLAACGGSSGTSDSSDDGGAGSSIDIPVIDLSAFDHTSSLSASISPSISTKDVYYGDSNFSLYGCEAMAAKKKMMERADFVKMITQYYNITMDNLDLSWPEEETIIQINNMPGGPEGSESKMNIKMKLYYDSSSETPYKSEICAQMEEGGSFSKMQEFDFAKSGTTYSGVLIESNFSPGDGGLTYYLYEQEYQLSNVDTTNHTGTFTIYQQDFSADSIIGLFTSPTFEWGQHAVFTATGSEGVNTLALSNHWVSPTDPDNEYDYVQAYGIIDSSDSGEGSCHAVVEGSYGGGTYSEDETESFNISGSNYYDVTRISPASSGTHFDEVEAYTLLDQVSDSGFDISYSRTWTNCEGTPSETYDLEEELGSEAAVREAYAEPLAIQETQDVNTEIRCWDHMPGPE